MLPKGTAFDSAVRRRLLTGFRLPELESILRVAPWDRDVADAVYLRRTQGGRGAMADVEAVYGRLQNYDLTVMKKRAALLADDPGQYREAYASIVSLDPDSGLDFGTHLAGRGEAVTLASFSGRPLQGVVVVESAPKFEALGLVAGAVLVAIEGQRVRDFEQYRCLRSLGDGSEATAIVWRGNAYVEIRAPLRRPHPALTIRSHRGP